MSDANANTALLQHLRSLEDAHGIEVLFAVVVGSRMWGFSDKNSDYDVKFVYRFTDKTHYTSFEHVGQSYKDSIHWETDDRKYDYAGWDLPKYLRHIAAQNTSVIEITKSTIILIDRYGLKKEMCEHILQFTRPDHLKHAYRGMLLSRKCCGVDTVKRTLHTARLLLHLSILDGQDRISQSCTFLDLINEANWGQDEKTLLYRLYERKVAHNEGLSAPDDDVAKMIVDKMSEHRLVADSSCKETTTTPAATIAEQRTGLCSIWEHLQQIP